MKASEHQAAAAADTKFRVSPVSGVKLEGPLVKLPVFYLLLPSIRDMNEAFGGSHRFGSDT